MKGVLVKERFWGQESLLQSPKRLLHETVKVTPGCVGYPRMLEVPEMWFISQGELQTEHGTSPRERRALQSAKLKGRTI